MTLLDECEALFNKKCLYSILGVKKNVTTDEIKTAYRKLSLKVHPDRNPEETATKKFQTLSRIYSCLSHTEKRCIYDETGAVDDDDLDIDKVWHRSFKNVTVDDIKQFEATFKGSKEELEELEKAYLDGKGSMDYILDHVLCTTIDDEPRFADILKKWIKTKKVPSFSKFVKESAASKKRRAEAYCAEAKEAEEYAAELGLGCTADNNNLHQLIAKQQAKRAESSDAFFDHLAAKYVNPKKSKKSTKMK